MLTTLQPFEEILLQYGLKRDDTLKFISEAEHLHSTDDVYHDSSRSSCTGWASIAERRLATGSAALASSIACFVGRDITDQMSRPAFIRLGPGRAPAAVPDAGVSPI